VTKWPDRKYTVGRWSKAKNHLTEYRVGAAHNSLTGEGDSHSVTEIPNGETQLDAEQKNAQRALRGGRKSWRGEERKKGTCRAQEERRTKSFKPGLENRLIDARKKNLSKTAKNDRKGCLIGTP